MFNKVKEVRTRMGLKQLALARKTGIDRSILSLIENGWKRPSPDQAERIRTVLGPDAIDGEQRK